ncbi:MAG TPA: hypothetical protein VNX22_09855 [Acidobacteriaceae bacterium]|nr:hypothetical protein [Acidobacteriaceae bacterium]
MDLQRPEKIILALLGSVIIALQMCIVSAFVGSGPRWTFIAGRWVEKVTTYQGLSQSLPIPFRPLESYYVYTDDKGRKVKHGPYKSFDRNGGIDSEAFYRDGKQDGTATYWNIKGQKTNESFYRMGQDIGWAVYMDGRLEYENVEIWENGSRVGGKKYDIRGWELTFNCGSRIDKSIDPQTGEVRDLVPPFAVACQP